MVRLISKEGLTEAGHPCWDFGGNYTGLGFKIDSSQNSLLFSSTNNSFQGFFFFFLMFVTIYAQTWTLFHFIKKTIYLFGHTRLSWWMWNLLCGMQILSLWHLVSQPGIEPGYPALGAQSLSPWTTREVPPRVLIKLYNVWCQPKMLGLFSYSFGVPVSRWSVINRDRGLKSTDHSKVLDERKFSFSPLNF